MNKKEETLMRFKKRIDERKPITQKEFIKDDSSLYSAVSRHLHGVGKACEELGISRQDMKDVYNLTNNIDKRSLTDEEIIERLTYLKSIGKLTTSAMRTQFDDTRLERSIKKRYGSVEKCFEILNLKRDRKRVTEESIKEEIINHIKNGHDLHYSNMIKIDSALVSNGTKKYNMGWHELLDLFSFEYQAIRKPFSYESIKDRLDDINNKFGTVNYSVLKEHDSSILFYAHQNYGSIMEFMEDMGYDYNEYSDTSINIRNGFHFEHAFKEILDALKIKNIHNKKFDDGVRPDFQLENNIWIDCKLSSWTFSTEDTVKRYLEYCDEIIIVYLRGVPYSFKGYEKYNVKFYNVSHFYPMLEKINRQDLIYKCQGILSETSELQESVTTERSIPSHNSDGKVTV